MAEFDGIIGVVGWGGGFAAGLASGEALEDLAGAVGGAVVDDQDFLAHGAFDYAAEDFVDRGFFVVDRDNHGELGVVESGWVAARGHRDRKSVVWGKRVDLGGRRIVKKEKSR